MTHEEKTKNVRALEAALFIYGEPMSKKKIKELLNVEAEEVEELITELKTILSGRGLELVQNDSSLQLVTHPDFGGLLDKIIKDEITKDITPASLETLSIVAYAGPISRSRIDYIRGVNSSYIVRNLLIRGLIERKPDAQRSNVYLYNVSFDLIRHLGIDSIKSLPDFENYNGLLLKAEKNLETLLTPNQGDVITPNEVITEDTESQEIFEESAKNPNENLEEAEE